MGYVRVAALFCLVAELCVMMLGWDVLTHAFWLYEAYPSGESLVGLLHRRCQGRRYTPPSTAARRGVYLLRRFGFP
jgi:hypothetical protein